MTVRRGTPADAHAVGAILDALSVKDRSRDSLDAETEPVWVAEEDGRVVGFASAGPSRSEEDVAELYALHVLPDARDSGAAHELMHAVIDWFIAEEYTTAMLWVPGDDGSARRFYEREGWRRDGERAEIAAGVDVGETLYRLTLVGA